MRTSNHPTLKSPRPAKFRPATLDDLGNTYDIDILVGSGAWDEAERREGRYSNKVLSEASFGKDFLEGVDGSQVQEKALVMSPSLLNNPAALRRTAWAKANTQSISLYQFGTLTDEQRDNALLELRRQAPKAIINRYTEDGKELYQSGLADMYLEVAGDDPADYVSQYVYATATSLYINKATKEAMPGTSFNVKHSRDTPSNGDKKVSATTYVNDSIELVSDTMYHPQAAKNGDIFEHNRIRYLNLYKPVDLSRVKAGTTDAVKIVKGHIAHLLEDPKEQEILINYLAHNAQYPGIKIPWAIVLQGVEGDGKSFFMEMMQSVMGFENVKSISGSTVMTNFTGWAVGQCMVFIEELKISGHGKYEALNNLKQFITNPTIEVIRKGKDGFNAINTSNYIALTNYQDAIPIGDNDRRYCVMFSRWQSKSDLAGFLSENPDYYERLYNNTAENAGEILDWLLTHEIPEWFMKTKRAPETAAKQAMIQAAKSPTLVAVEDALDEFMPWIFEGDELNVTKLQEEVKRKQALAHNSPIYDDFPKTKALSSILTEMGWQPSGRRRPKGSTGNKNSFYRKR